MIKLICDTLTFLSLESLLRLVKLQYSTKIRYQSIIQFFTRFYKNKKRALKNVSNLIIVDEIHYLDIGRYEYADGEAIRFGAWCKYNKLIFRKYVKNFWQLWRINSRLPT